MSGRTANCPNCAGPIEFKNAATLYVVCPYCGGASQRQDVNLHYLGKVAAVADIDSPFDLGARGDFKGLGWTIVGQLQLDHGHGPWNEWCAVFDDGSWRWIAEAQGKVYLTREVDIEPLAIPSHGFLQPGEALSLGEHGDFVVAETGQGTVVAARGELPVLIITGTQVNYTDLSGGDDRFATLDYGDGTECVAAYAGERLDFRALGFHPESVGRKEAKRVDVDRLGCDACGAPLQVRDPESLRIGCEACGALIDTASRTVVAKQGTNQRKPLIPLGSAVTLRGTAYTLLAYLIRSVTAYGTRYPWAEYLLRNDGDGSYRWLIHQNGHWNFVTPVELGDCRKGGSGATAAYKGRSFKHFTSGVAVVEYVLGEVYWAVEQGEEARADDFVAPPEMLSFESSERGGTKETVASLTTYLPHTEVQAAFKLAKVARPRGVAPNQPNPHAVKPWLPWWLGMVAVVIVMMIGFHVTFDQRELVQLSGTFQPGAPPAEAEVVFSNEFEISAPRGNVQVTLSSQGGSGNYWIGFDGALANTVTGDVHVFTLSGQYWHGVSGGERWSEGTGGDTIYLGSVPRGTYALRLQRQREPIKAGAVAWQIAATSQVPSVFRPILLLFLLSIVPVVVLLRRGAFETQRWAESDHAA